MLAGPEGNIVTESSAAYHVSAQEIQEMIEELADAQRRLVAMHDQIRLLVWLGKEEN